jgi:4-amino-4-deoxy-L-arabinose transferase-like glycosyltransferase
MLVPAVDFDEALYAEFARVMLATGDFLQPRWDGSAVFDKPPPFIWTLLPFGHAYDPSSFFAGLMRLPNLLSSLAIALACGWLLRRSQPKTLPAPSVPWSFGFALYFCALMPAVGSGLLLIDLLLSVWLFPVFVILDRSVQMAKGGMVATPKFSHALIAGVCMAGATATKGLIGLVIPGLAAGVAILWVRGRHSIFYALLQGARAYAPMAAVALLGSAAFFGGLWLAGHQDFVTAFFMVHHFGRGSSAMEGHGGSFLYHWVVVFIGGGWTSAAILKLVAKKIRHPATSLRSRMEDFPAVWTLVVIGFFSLMATKLPNYTWPCWLALPFVVTRLAHEAQDAKQPACHKGSTAAQPHLWKRLTSNVVEALVFLLGSVFALGAVAALLLPLLLGPQPLFDVLGGAIDERALAIIQSTQPNGWEQTAFVLLGVTLGALAVLVFRTALLRDPVKIFRDTVVVLWTHAALLLVTIFGLGPLVQRTFVDPVLGAAVIASEQFPQHDVLTFGIRSPSFSSMYRGTGRIRQVGSDSDAHMGLARPTVLVVPSWSPGSCQEMGARTIQQLGWLWVCDQNHK